MALTYLHPALVAGRVYLAPLLPPDSTPSTPTVTGVTVSPSITSVAGGATKQFTAAVLGPNSPSQAVTWSAPAGTISLAGLFTAPVATDTAQYIDVVATSVLDPSFSGTATVYVPAAGVQPDPDPDPSIPDERNYAWLQAEVLEWLHRKDLASKVPKFITMAEARINRIVQARGMEIESTLTFAPGVGAVRLPAGFDTPIAAWLLTDTGRCDLSAVVPEQLSGTKQRGTPQHWAVSGSYLALDRPVDVARRVTLRYRGLLRLSEAAPNNSVLSKYPDLYLYGTLMEAAMFIRDPDSLSMWAPLFDTAVKEINRNESRARAIAPLRTELADLVGWRH